MALDMKPISHDDAEKSPKGAIDFADQKKRKNRIKKLKSEITTAEATVERYEHLIGEIETLLMNAGDNIDETLRLSKTHQDAQDKLDEAISHWEKCCEDLDGLVSI